MLEKQQRVLWWGHFDPNYSRNRILRQAFAGLGWKIEDFHPHMSKLADLEAAWWRRFKKPDLVFVPCFRQRDIAAARRYSRRLSVALMIDPLISAYDKQVFERGKFSADSYPARRLRAWEQGLFQGADSILADTREHARYFAETFGIPINKIHVVHVGAEAPLFIPAPSPQAPNHPIEVLFFGSFIPLQGPTTIIDAARLHNNPGVRWHLLGNGPLLAKCQQKAKGLTNVVFEKWVPYTELPERIRHADILLGVFGTTPKAGRVIPNKIYQALACGKPVVTRTSMAYPKELFNAKETGISWVPAGNPKAIVQAVSQLAAHPTRLARIGMQARGSFEVHFSNARIVQELLTALNKLPH